MLRLSLISIVTTSILLYPVAAAAEGIWLPKGVKIVLEEADADGNLRLKINLLLDAARFLIERSDIDYYNLIEKSLKQCTGALVKCEDRECEAVRAAPAGDSFLELLGWKVIIPTLVAVLAGGIALGVWYGVSVAPTAGR